MNNMESILKQVVLGRMMIDHILTMAVEQPEELREVAEKYLENKDKPGFSIDEMMNNA